MPRVPAVPAANMEAFPALVAVHRSYGVAGMSRPAGEYNGCTWVHLPAKNGTPLRSMTVEAIFAIFAARIAFSNFPMRSRLK